MMSVMWRVFEFTRKIPQAEQKTCLRAHAVFRTDIFGWAVLTFSIARLLSKINT